jgi:hypothetical protein
MCALFAACAIFTATAAGQPDAPVVTMMVTLPDGGSREITAPESGLVTVTLKDGTEYGFRPTVLDSRPWNRVAVTVFRMPTASAATEVLGEIELKAGGPAADSKTKPAFKIAISKVAPPVNPVPAATTSN